MKRRRKPKPGRSKSSRRRRQGVLALAVAVLGFGAFLWLKPRPPAPMEAARTAVAQPTRDKSLPKPVAPPALTSAPARSLPRPASSSPASKTPLPAPPPLPAQTNPAPPALPPQTNPAPPECSFPRPVRDVAEAQIALARLGISSGSVDGRLGAQTALALKAFQRMHSLPATGQLDPATRETLLLTRTALGKYVLKEPDLKRLQPLSATWAGKAQQTALEYESILELVAEKSRAHPDYLRRLNPAAAFLSPPVGAGIIVPDTELEALTPCAFITISLSQRLLEAFDSRSNLVAHFPCSIARRVEKRPAGELRVASIAPDPNYTFDPARFPESPEAGQIGRKLILPPGPNNPVGTAWIGLDRPGYGIHGTPQPEQVGRTESHGCFRLANWNAEHLIQIVRIGTPVYVE